MIRRTKGIAALGISSSLLITAQQVVVASNLACLWHLPIPIQQASDLKTSQSPNIQAVTIGGQAAVGISQTPLPQTIWDLMRVTGKLPTVPAFTPTGFATGNTGAFSPNSLPGTGRNADIIASSPGVYVQAARPQTVWDVMQKFGNVAPVITRSPEVIPLVTAGNPDAGLFNPNNALQNPAEPQGPYTVWDFLRKGDPAHPLTVSLAGIANQVQIDPKTGMPRVQPEGPKKKLTGALAFFDSLGQAARRIGNKLNTQITVRGEKNIGYHAEKVGGNSISYSNDNYFGVKGIGGSYNQTELTVQGKVLGLLNFQTHYSDSPYKLPNENRLSLNYETKRLKFDAGDINGSITGNSLIDFNRTLKGIEVSAEVLKGLRLTTLMSQTKAQTRTIVIQGANISGPYYVYAGQIVDGSEHVRVNNVDQIKGTDYTLDPQTGELRFIKPGTIIHDFDSIAITFESYNFQQQAGSINGYRADLTTFKNVKFGVAYLQQRTSAASSALATRTDQFYGYESPLSPYQLTYSVNCTIVKDSTGKPISATPLQPMTALIDGVPQVYGTDFQIDPLLTNRVFFRSAVPRTSLIKITYTPANDNTATGNRNVTGVDSQITLGKTGLITAEFANSTIDTSGGSSKGTAAQIRGDMRFLKDKLTWNWNLKSIDPTFTSIETAGFQRNEKGFSTGFNYSASKDLKFTFNLENSKRPSYSNTSFSGSSISNVAGLDDYHSTGFSANYTFGKGARLSFTHNNMDTILAAGGKSTYGNDNLDLNYKLKEFTFGIALSQNDSTSLFNTTSGSSTTSSLTDSKALTSRFNLQWAASKMVNLTTVFTNSKLSGTNRNTNAQDMQFNASLTPSKGLQINLGYGLQNSGGYSQYGNTTSTGSGSGSGSGSGGGGIIVRKSADFPDVTRQTGGSDFSGGYYGGGFNGGLGSSGSYGGGLTGGYSSSSLGNAGGNTHTTTLGINYQPSQSLNLAINLNRSSSFGDYLYNSKRNDISFVSSYNLGERINLTGNLTSQNVSYIGSTGGTSTNSLGLSMRALPFKKLVTSLNFSSMKTNSSGTGTGGTGTGTGIGTGTGFFGGTTNLTSYGFRAEYPVFRMSNFFIQTDMSQGSGYAASDTKNSSIGLDFLLSQQMTFTLGWRIQQHMNKDTTTGSASYNYNVSSLDANLRLHFN